MSRETLAHRQHLRPRHRVGRRAVDHGPGRAVRSCMPRRASPPEWRGSSRAGRSWGRVPHSILARARGRRSLARVALDQAVGVLCGREAEVGALMAYQVREALGTTRRFTIPLFEPARPDGAPRFDGQLRWVKRRGANPMARTGCGPTHHREARSSRLRRRPHPGPLSHLRGSNSLAGRRACTLLVVGNVLRPTRAGSRGATDSEDVG
jgi:hypothetical protein